MKVLRSLPFLGFILSINIFVWGALLSEGVFKFITPEINGVFYKVTVAEDIKQYLAFCVAYAIIPLLLIFTWITGNITKSKSRYASILIVLTAVVLSIITKQLIIKKFSHDLLDNMLTNEKEKFIYLPSSNLNFWLYILIGAISGCLISYAIYHQRNAKSA